MLYKIIDAIKESEINGLAFKDNSDILSGFSGNKLVGALQRLSALYEEDGDACYLEVGVFQGLTLLSVASACPKLACYGIDNFAYFDPNGENLSVVEQRATKLDVQNKFLINLDYEDALESLNQYLHDKKVGLYFVDGPHDYRSQLMCLELILPYLHRDSVIVVDDCNYLHVRQANRDFLVTHPEFKLVFEAYTKCHPKNMNSSDEADARKGWWDGVNIIARDPQNLLPKMYPPTERSRLLYENDHITHAARLAEITPQAIEMANHIYSRKPIKTLKSLVRICKESLHNRKKYGKRFDNMNTFSEDLPKFNFNQIM
jgi:hypothetical protein